MRKFYYEIANVPTLIEKAASWIGTPYQHMGRTKKAGVDCIHFVGMLLTEMGLLRELKMSGFYPTDWYDYGQELMTDTIANHAANCMEAGIIAQYSPEDMTCETGDMICLKVLSQVTNHVVIKLDKNRIIHAVPSAGVVYDNLDRWKNNIARVYKFYYEE